MPPHGGMEWSQATWIWGWLVHQTTTMGVVSQCKRQLVPALQGDKGLACQNEPHPPNPHIVPPHGGTNTSLLPQQCSKNKTQKMQHFIGAHNGAVPPHGGTTRHVHANPQLRVLPPSATERTALLAL